MCSRCSVSRPQGARNITFDASQLYASAAQSSLLITPGAPGTVGVMQYVVANLLSSTRAPVVVADNVKVIATGRLPLCLQVCADAGGSRTHKLYAVLMVSLRCIFGRS
jgi:hypothetical protein